MEHIVEFCGYIRSNDDILSHFRSVPSEATIATKLDYVNQFMKSIQWFTYDLQIRRAYTMEHIVEFCGYIRSNEDILSHFRSVPSEATIATKLDYAPMGIVKPNVSSIHITNTVANTQNKSETLTTNAFLNVDVNSI
ncbi:unnamed protein product [Rotaria magnacalcarata]|uniref:Uncharacterized protein n=1 Tax=Rotaria magnacalcarata TaxID=392030 RepID=A0A8S2QUG9_9BILA|nr:unnamed protein product [Rotaria magnacalcarata]